MKRSHLKPRIALRGWSLLVLSYTWTLIGVAVLLGYSPERDSVWHTAIPEQIRFFAWIIPAILSAIAGVTAKPRVTVFALVGLMIMPTIRFMSYGWSWLMSVIPGVPDGYPTGWYTAALHIPLICLVVIVAHIPPPSVLPRPVRTEAPEEGH